MAKKNDDFFDEKKDWSKVKDALLGNYFKPYVQKILHTYRPLIYVDCFAGKGKFADGNPGSPVIALDIINECEAQTRVERSNIEATFIDLNYAADLQKNLSGYSGVNIVSGKYEENIKRILKDKDNCNVFLYIDPYGIKALQCSLFDYFAKRNFNSIELLINLNSFGFVREACHAMGASFDAPDVFEDLIEYDSTKLDATEKSIRELNEIAGGDYWQAIIVAYKKKEIDGYEAESQFAEQYCMRLMDNFRYVLNMPLRIKRGQRPKYRMIHATNHTDGCLLMVDNICKRWEMWQDVQNEGQTTLFPETYDNQFLSEETLERMVVEHFSQCSKWISLSEALAIFFVMHGPICKTGEATKILSSLEKEGRLSVLRNPEKTEKGSPTKFMTEGKGKTVSVRWKT